MAVIERPARVDPRLGDPTWDPCEDADIRDRVVRILVPVNVALAVWYFGWLLQPSRVGHPLLYGLLIAAEMFNLVQATGFWWTCAAAKRRTRLPPIAGATVDVFIPTYNEPPDVVGPTIEAALRIRGAQTHVFVLDDGDRPQMEALAHRLGASYIRRDDHSGAKAGNINHALLHTSSPYIAIFDCDHVPDERFLEETLPHFRDEHVAFVQTPQYYANRDGDGVHEASWAQQALFFGPIARGKDGMDAMFCCGTNMVFRRAALERVGGFPTKSVTEDFELSIRLHESGWRSVYVPEVLARGLAPTDMASYVSQQFRWARGCVSTIPRVIFSRLRARIRIQYLLSSMFFLSGWTLAIYMSMPIIRLVTGDQPLQTASANVFLLHFAPYFLTAIGTVALAGGGTYTFSAFALVAGTYWVHIAASLAALLHLRTRFRVTPKEGKAGPQLTVVIPTLISVSVLMAAAGYGVMRGLDIGTLNNIGFAALHMTVLLRGVWPAVSQRT